MFTRKAWKLKVAFACLLIIVIFRYSGRTNLHYNVNERDLSDEEIRHFVDIPDLPNIELVKGLFNLSNPGHRGAPVLINREKLPEDERIKYDRSKEENGYHNYVSNLISVHRKTPAPVPEECKRKTYDIARLPQTSVVIIFINETWVTLLRTIHSVLDNTPESLLKEIILVDDNSTKPHLLKPLDDYLARYPKVRIIRTGRRVGLIRARIIGFDAATATTVSFMDSHCESFPGWLEPQLERIVSDYKIVTTPMIAVIDMTTFSVYEVPEEIPGLVFPSSFYDWIMIPDRELNRRASPTDPILTPGMEGALFTISKQWFEELGKYDEALSIWGGENTELALKTWMCGGSMETIPCAKVGHVYRSHFNYKLQKDAFNVNFGRVASVWMDEYKKFIPNWDGSIADIGDISERLEIRERLQCHSFQWFIDNVHPEIYILGDGVYTGEIRNVNFSSYCVDGNGFSSSKPVVVYACHGQGGAQTWDLTDLQEIRHDRHCLGYKDGVVGVIDCRYTRGSKEWYYDGVNIMTNRRDKCLGVDSNWKLVLQDCDGSGSQKWKWKWNRTQRKV